MNKRFFGALGILVGTIIGAGIFSLPYIFGKIGVIYGAFCLVVFSGIYFTVHMMYARIAERSSGTHQFFYFAEKYLEKPFGNIASAMILMELILVLGVYIILAPLFAHVIFPSVPMVYLLFVFWALGSVAMFANVSWLGIAESLGSVSILLIPIALFFLYRGSLNISLPMTQPLTPFLFFLPFGPLLFSLSGRPAIAKVVEEHRDAECAGSPFSLRGVIFWGTTIPALVYLVFAIGVLRIAPNVSEDALGSLGFLPLPFVILLNAMGLIALITSYVVVGINVKDIFEVDLHYPKWVGAFFAIFMPIALYGLGMNRFISAISFTGGIFLALEGIFVVRMWQKAFPKHALRRWSWALCLVFIAAIIYEVVNAIV